ncbi:DUF1007 family protein [Vibrio mediterranei]|jgi:ABC-type uncharacterized transport system substrate-binding protein|uniref:DUF1007 family protein n=1 Tax=Vibrio mediterranei TaxID=689 RepID=A0AAN1KQC9_9VIBR|nr:DUF1007 family protein [Vibrio mediterranei]ASI92339.1 hypothetical protein BSZ05_21285 [Vibrio mediterranei]NOI24532.1 DUF1007 family protein [Vibrio mediterranei]
MFNRFVLKSSYWRRVLVVALVTLSTNANAHPHSWIGNQLTVNGKGTLVDSISMEWVFDPFTSAYALDGDFSVFDSEETAHKEAVRLMSNLLNTHYFTYLYVDGEPLKFRLPEVYTLTKRGRRMVLNFTLPLSRAIDVSTQELDVQVYDNTYFIDISWKDPSTVTLSPDVSGKCRTTLETPSPSQEILDYANSLGIDEQGDDDLGAHFSQKVSIHCE